MNNIDNNSNIMITSMEDNLKNDFDGNVLKSYIAQINLYKRKANKKLINGCRVKDYNILESIKNSWSIAESIMYSLSDRINNSL